MKNSLINKKVRIISDNENYTEYVGKTLIITNAATNEDEHRGYDTSMGKEALCDLKTLSGESVPFSLYEYEFERV